MADLTRRSFIGSATAATAVFTSLPAGSIPADTSAIAERVGALVQELVDTKRAARSNDDARRAAQARLPEWAAPGFQMLNHEGKGSGAFVGWPAIENVTPPENVGASRMVRPGFWEMREQFGWGAYFAGADVAKRAEARAAYRRRVRSLVARIRAQRDEEAKAGLPEIEARGEAFSERIEAICDEILDLEGVDEPNVTAANILVSLSLDILPTNIEDAFGGTLLHIRSLRAMRYQLSGPVAEHVAGLLDAPHPTRFRTLPLFQA